MQISSALSSYANAAFDTVRSNLKSMAEAAAEQRTPDVTPALATTPEPQPAAPEAPQPAKGQRQGVSLDAYA